MSLKEQVDFLKEEISTEEKFFEGFFKLEKVWKKYKVAIVSISLLLFVLFIVNNINQYIQTQNKIKANIAFNTLLNNPKDNNSIKILKDLNPKLLAISIYLNNVKQGKNEVVNIEFLDDITRYNIAMNKNDLESINKVLLSSKFLLKEYTLFQKALILTLDKKYQDAKETLSLIPSTSPVSQLSNKLRHYLLTK